MSQIRCVACKRKKGDREVHARSHVCYECWNTYKTVARAIRPRRTTSIRFVNAAELLAGGA